MLKFIKNKESFLKKQKKLWTENHDFWANTIKRDEKSGEINKYVIALLTDLLKKYKKPLIIDAGCGHGWIYDSLSSKKSLSFDYYGFDFISGFIESNLKKNVGNKNAHFIEYDLTKPNIPPELKLNADIILNNFNLVELWDIEQAFKNMSNMLNNNGTLIIVTKDMTSVIASHSIDQNDFNKTFDKYVNRKSRLGFTEEIIINAKKHTGKYFCDAGHSIADYVNNAAKNNLYLIQMKEIIQKDVTIPQLGLIFVFKKIQEETK